MALSIEAKLLALVDSDHADRVLAVLEDYYKVDGNKVDWAFVDEFGQPLLLRLVETATTQTMALIIKLAGPEMLQTVKDENSGTSLHYAALNEHAEVALKLVEACPMLVDSIDGEGCYPLHRAAKQGNAEILSSIIPAAGANVQDSTGSKWTPLHYAASGRKVEAVKILLEQGAEKSIVDSHGRTALEVASERSFLDVTALLSP